jgi:hypothetical protein
MVFFREAPFFRDTHQNANKDDCLQSQFGDLLDLCVTLCSSSQHLCLALALTTLASLAGPRSPSTGVPASRIILNLRDSSHCLQNGKMMYRILRTLWLTVNRIRVVRLGVAGVTSIHVDVGKVRIPLGLQYIESI